MSDQASAGGDQQETSLRQMLVLAEAWRAIAHLPQGEIIIRDLMTITGLLSTPQAVDAAGRTDMAATMVAVGRAQIGLEVMERLRWSVAELEKFGRAVSHDTLGALDRAGDFP